MEFVLVAPVLFTMIFGVLEYGFVFYGYSAIEYGANNVARGIAVNRIAIARAEAEVNAYLPPWMNPVTVTSQLTNPADPTRSSVQLSIVAPASGMSPIGFFTSAFPMTLTTTVAVNQELPFDNGDGSDDGDDDDGGDDGGDDDGGDDDGGDDDGNGGGRGNGDD